MKTNISLMDNNPRIKAFKKQAKILHKELQINGQSINLRACQDLVAKQNGYKHWHHFHTEIKNLYEIKDQKNQSYFFKDIPHDCLNYGWCTDMGLYLGLNNKSIHTFIEGDNRDKVNLHFAKQIVEQHQPLIYLDGTENSFSNIEKIYQLAKKSGREKNVYFINFKSENIHFLNNKKSHTFNPLLNMSASQLTEIFVSTLDDYDSMWKGRAISLMSALMMALVYMRDEKEIILDFKLINDYLTFDMFYKLYKTRKDFPEHIQNALKDYLFSLPDFDEYTIKQSYAMIDQHGYLQMQFAQILSVFIHYIDPNLNDYPDIDFLNLPKNSIILMAFPEFKKSLHYVSLFSYLMTSLIKSGIANKISTLGFKANQFDKSYIIINECPLPTGFAVVPAQAKAAGSSIIFSYSNINDYAFSKDEAISLKANCNIKLQLIKNDEYEFRYKELKYNLKI